MGFEDLNEIDKKIEGLETGKNRYEIEIYESGRLIRIFRSDTEFALPILKGNAERFCDRLRKIFPEEDYYFEENKYEEIRRNRYGFGG